MRQGNVKAKQIDAGVTNFATSELREKFGALLERSLFGNQIMRKLLRAIILVFGLLLCLPSFSWDDYGHRLVARVSYSRLTPEARAAVEQLLGGGVEAFVNASVWADQVKSKRPETRPWHYVNMP